MQVYIDQFIVPVWATSANLVKSNDFIKGAWAMVFLDDADAPGALAYHELTPDGLPSSKVFVRTTLQNGDLVSVSASHELVEMLVDPAINLMSTGPDLKAVYAYESADPVEALSFAVNGILMSDFIYPAYFENFRKAASVKFDQMDKVQRPFEILKDGYQIVFKDREWSQVFGSAGKKKVFEKEIRVGHGSEDFQVVTGVGAKRTKIAKAEAAARKQAKQALAKGSMTKAKTVGRFAGHKRKRVA